MKPSTLSVSVHTTANRNQKPAARPVKPFGPPWFCCTLVWMDVMIAAPAAHPTCNAQLKIAPTIPATLGGVDAKTAMLHTVGLVREDH